MPLEYAFAFRWWSVLAVTAIAAYFFALRILEGKKLLATLVGASFAISPFLLWWYQPTAFLAISYALLGMILLIRIMRKQSIPGVRQYWLTNLLYSFTLAYTAISFALIFYPPFLVPISIAAGGYLAGFAIRKKLVRKEAMRVLGILAVAIFCAGLSMLIFLAQHRNTIDRIAGSIYPGHRIVESGGQSPAVALGSFLMPLLQDSSRAENYYANQSEASNFILLLPFLLIPGFAVLIREWLRKKQILWELLIVQLVALLFLCRMYVHFGDPFYRLILLDRVPNNRLVIGLGFVGFLQLLLFIKSLQKNRVRWPRGYALVGVYGLVCLVALLLFGRTVIHTYPGFVRDYATVAILALLQVVIVVCLLLNKKRLAAFLLLLFTIGSSVNILPIYRGLGFLAHSKLIEKMEAVSKPGESWVVLDSMNFEALPWAAGRGNLGGPQIYTDLKFWEELDKSRTHQFVYNRQAHAVFLTNENSFDGKTLHNLATVNGDLELVKGNVFKVKFSCTDFFYKHADFALSTHPVRTYPCLDLKGTVKYPKATFYIYRILSR